ncbi:MAG: hypothetical protein ACE5R4_08630 [Armatimonadota bacterium]
MADDVGRFHSKVRLGAAGLVGSTRLGGCAETPPLGRPSSDPRRTLPAGEAGRLHWKVGLGAEGLAASAGRELGLGAQREEDDGRAAGCFVVCRDGRRHNVPPHRDEPLEPEGRLHELREGLLVEREGCDLLGDGRDQRLDRLDRPERLDLLEVLDLVDDLEEDLPDLRPARRSRHDLPPAASAARAGLGPPTSRHATAKAAKAVQAVRQRNWRLLGSPMIIAPLIRHLSPACAHCTHRAVGAAEEPFGGARLLLGRAAR